MHVNVIGGGVAGLCAALAFRHRAGMKDVRVYERDPCQIPAERMGHGLILMQNGVDALAAIGASGLLDECTPLRRAIFRDATGRITQTDDIGGVYCMTRAAVILGLRERLPTQSIVYEKHCVQVALDERGGVGSVHFADSTVLPGSAADLWVGAEGYRSPMCGAFNPGFERHISPVHEVVTSSELPELARELGDRFVKTRFPDRGLAFGLLSPSEGRVIGFLQFDANRYDSPPRGTSQEQLRSFLLDLLDGAPDPIGDYLRVADMSAAHVWRPVDAAIPARLHGPNAVLIGDAAHPMLPFTSQGVSAALEDGIVLADLMRREGLPALGAFADARRRAAQVFIAGGRRILASFVGQDPEFQLPYIEGDESELAGGMGLEDQAIGAVVELIDTNRDGVLQRSEFRSLVGLAERSEFEEDADQLFDEIDADADGVLTSQEVAARLGQGGAGSARMGRLRAALAPHQVDQFTIEKRMADVFGRLRQEGPLTPERVVPALAAVEIMPSEAAVVQLLAAVEGRDDLEVAIRDWLGDKRVGRSAPEDPLFADSQVDRAILRQRAFNFRWATLPDDVIPLTAADPDFPMAQEIREALHDYIAAGYMSYGPAEGLPEFRTACADWLARRHGIPGRPDCLLATNSAASSLYLAARYCLEPGQQALIADPVDFLLERSVVAAGCTVKRFPVWPRENPEPRFDLDAIRAMIEPGKTRLLSLCNPHNPLGMVWNERELRELAELALEHDLWILSDEVWGDIVHPPHRLVSVASLGPEIAARTFTVTGFSKNFALAGLRLGVLVSPSPEIHQAIVTMSHADETAYGVSTLSQIAGIAACTSAGPWQRRFLRHLCLRRDHAVARLRQMPGVTCHLPQGTFVAFPRLTGFDGDPTELVDQLRDRYRIAVVPGSPRFFGPAAAGHLRISFATSKGILDEGLDRLERGLTELRVGSIPLPSSQG